MIQHECRCPGCGSCGAAQREEKLREEIVRLRFAIKALYDKPYVDSLRSLVDSKNGERIVAEHRAMVAERERDELKAQLAHAEAERDARRARNRVADAIITAAPQPDREALGRVVRRVWMDWAEEQPSPKPSWLVPWQDLGEADREVDRRIGEALVSVPRAERDELKAQLAHAEADAEQAIHNEAFMERQRIISYIRARLAHATMEDRFGRERGLLIDLANAIEAGEPAGETR